MDFLAAAFLVAALAFVFALDLGFLVGLRPRVSSLSVLPPDPLSSVTAAAAGCQKVAENYAIPESGACSPLTSAPRPGQSKER